MRHAGAGTFITLLHSSHCKVDKRGRKHRPPFTPGSRSSRKRLFGATGHFCVRTQDCGSKMKRHSAITKQRSLASYFKKVRTDEADGEEPPPSKDKTSPSSALVESQARPNFCSDSGECTGLYESPENDRKQDTHAPPGNDGGHSATPSYLCSTVNAGQSDAFTTGQSPRKATFYPGDFTRVDVDPGTDFFHTEKAEELPLKSYEQRQIDRTSTAQHPSRTSSDPRTSPHRILQVAEKEKLPRLNFPLCFKSRLNAKPS
ncbi:hypothetical protein HPB51_015739 [Rhipicephalus microplus]|uniref:Uncharacterized protein n=1 Tax=Rhipicephalus microplus TaxID=6941 RepID=A0A9J6ETP6_RHIMP|nr:hypothetical protein HPB51_015739 [Rhipicephalus microplus]